MFKSVAQRANRSLHEFSLHKSKKREYVITAHASDRSSDGRLVGRPNAAGAPELTIRPAAQEAEIQAGCAKALAAAAPPAARPISCAPLLSLLRCLGYCPCSERHRGGGAMMQMAGVARVWLWCDESWCRCGVVVVWL